MTQYLRSVFLGSLLWACAAAPALAGSFSINENSANDLGRANAGRVVSTDDALAAFGNPALMTRFEALTLSNHISYIAGNAAFEDQGSVDLQGNPLGGDVDDFFENAFVPALQVVLPAGDRWAVGLSVNAPFGLASEYEPDSVARFQAIRSKLTTINVNPTIAFALSDRLSVGGGVSLQYAKAELSSAINLDTVVLPLIDCVQAPCNAVGQDGLSEIEGDDFSWGWNIGIALQPTDALTLGATYRSEVDHELDGEADFTLPDSPIVAGLTAQTGLFQDTDGRAQLDLPSMLEFGARLQATDRLALFADLSVLYWSDLTELRVDFENPAQPPTIEELEYDTAARYAVGADYDISPDWTVRAGLAFDETPSTPEFATARIPDNDRIYYAVGVTFTGLHIAQLDIGYNYIDVDPTDFDRTNRLGDRVRGRVSADAHVLSVGFTKRF